MTNVWAKDLKAVLFLLPLFISMHCFSQNQEEPGVSDIIKANFFNPGVSYEKATGKFQSLYGNAYMNMAFSAGYSSSLGSSAVLYFDPALALQYRFYYGFKKRTTKGKRTAMNNLNYLCAATQAVFSKHAISDSYIPQRNIRPVHAFGIAWGLQRNYPKRFSLDFNFGVGYFYAKSTTLNYESKTVGNFTTVGQLSLGFWLNKRQSVKKS